MRELVEYYYQWKRTEAYQAFIAHLQDAMVDDAGNASSNDDCTDAESNASSVPLVASVPPLQYDAKGQAALEAAGELDRRAYVEGKPNSTKARLVLSDGCP